MELGQLLWAPEYGAGPAIRRPANRGNYRAGTLGDLDGDSVSNLVEAAFAAMQLDPLRSDSTLLPIPQFRDGRFVAEYRRHRQDRFNISLSFSPDLHSWLNPGDPGFPSGLRDIDLGTGTGDYENRRIELTLPPSPAGFVRWLIVNPQ